MKRLFLLLVFSLTSLTCLQAAGDSLLQQLSVTMKKASEFDAAKNREIAQLKAGLASYQPSQLRDIFRTNEKIYEEYAIFNYDSAFRYANELIRLSGQLNERGYMVSARLKLSFILLSAGLYKETFDSL